MSCIELKRYRELIRNMPVMDYTSVSKTETWCHHKDPRLGRLLERFSNEAGRTVSISKRDIFRLARNGITPEFIFATYIWGYPNGNRGRYTQVFKQVGNICMCLRGIGPRIDEDNWMQEYMRLDDAAAGVGVSTWTKLLQFLKIKIGQHRALILDTKIIDVLRRGTFCELVNAPAINYDNAPRLYVEYLRMMYREAHRLNVDADKLEMFLYVFGRVLKA